MFESFLTKVAIISVVVMCYFENITFKEETAVGNFQAESASRTSSQSYKHIQAENYYLL